MTKTYYTIVSDRTTAVAYLAAEFGVGKVISIMERVTPIRQAAYRLSDVLGLVAGADLATRHNRRVFTSRKKAEQYAARVNAMAANSFGKIGSRHCPAARVEGMYGYEF